MSKMGEITQSKKIKTNQKVTVKINYHTIKIIHGFQFYTYNLKELEYYFDHSHLPNFHIHITTPSKYSFLFSNCNQYECNFIPPYIKLRMQLNKDLFYFRVFTDRRFLYIINQLN